MMTEILNLLSQMIVGADWADAGRRERWSVYLVLLGCVALASALIIGLGLSIR